MPPRNEADRRPPLRRRYRQYAIFDLKYGRIWRPDTRQPHCNRCDQARDEENSWRDSEWPVRRRMDERMRQRQRKFQTLRRRGRTPSDRRSWSKAESNDAVALAKYVGKHG